MKENILVVTSGFTGRQIETLRTFCQENDCDFNLAHNFAEAEPYLPEATIIYGGSARIIANAPKLKWFHSGSAGVNTYIPVLKEDTILTNSSGAYGLSIAEHLIMVTLMLLRKMPVYQEIIRNRSWKYQFQLDSLYGQRITVLGTGDIGGNFAARVRAFLPQNLIGVNRSGRQAEPFDTCYPVRQLDEILPQTDLLVCCIPETPETINLINRERIALLPDGARIVNVGRGSLIDENALIDALKSGKLAGAALDVFRKEPLPEDSPLYDTPNLIMTPHCSGNMTVDYTIETNFNIFYTNLKHYFNDEPLEHVVDRKLGY